MSDPLMPGEVEINGWKAEGGLSVETEAIDVTPAIKVRPDTTWTYTDPAGHFHAFSDLEDDTPLPTLDRKERAIEHDDPDDEAWTEYESWYECRICHAVVEPVWIETASTFREFAPGRTSWTVQASGPDDASAPRSGDEVMVRVREPHHEAFGVGIVYKVERVAASAIRLTIAGAGPLGRRAVPAVQQAGARDGA